jgi:hypothetical protein
MLHRQKAGESRSELIRETHYLQNLTPNFKLLIISLAFWMDHYEKVDARYGLPFVNDRTAHKIHIQSGYIAVTVRS